MKRIIIGALLASALSSAGALAEERRDDDRNQDKVTLAVFGDWPYGQVLYDNAQLLINSVNADPAVSRIIHVGDIHSGSQPCTSAGILPPIPASIPGYNQQIYFNFQQFRSPLVYTPGDNEWTDCHKTKQAKSGQPLNELAAVRSLFFARPGKTLGIEEREVYSQSKHFDPAYPIDAQYVENVIWEQAHVVFVTVNMPGSNNDTLPWTNGFEKAADHQAEIANRTAADTRWLQAAFRLAHAHEAKGVVIGQQADMWDPAALVAGGDGLAGYTPFVQEIATQTLGFKKPVLLINGDTHIFGVDKPLADPTSATGLVHKTAAVPNLTRIVVQGSTNAPAEWLRLTVDSHTPSVFSWTNVPYCANPLNGPC